MHVTTDYLIRYDMFYLKFHFVFFFLFSFYILRYSITIYNYYFRLVTIIMGFLNRFLLQKHVSITNRNDKIKMYKQL